MRSWSKPRTADKDETNKIIELLKDTVKAIVEQAEKNKDAILPGYTHLQRAQPVTFAHHLSAYGQMFRRDIQRLDDAYKRINMMILRSEEFPKNSSRKIKRIGIIDSVMEEYLALRG